MLHDFEIVDKKLIVRVDAKTQERLDEYRKSKSSEGLQSTEEIDIVKEEDSMIKGQLLIIMKEHEIELARDLPDQPNSKSSKRYNTPKQVEQKQEVSRR